MSTDLTLIDDKTAALQFDGGGVELEIPSPHQGQEEQQVDVPIFDIKLEWVYGYRGCDSHKTIVLITKEEEMIYFTATIAVIFSLEAQTQRFYRKHNGNIRCIALHPDQEIIVSGQEANHQKKECPSSIHLWKPLTLETLKIINSDCDFQEAVIYVAFSHHDDGATLCAVSRGDCYVLSVWNWNHGSQLAKPFKSNNPIMNIEFSPLCTNLIELISCGRGQLYKWELDVNTRTLSPTHLLENVANRNEKECNYVTCFGCFPNGDVLFGDSNGYLSTYGRETNAIERRFRPGNETPIVHIQFLPNKCFVTCNSDGLFIKWDTNHFTCIKRQAIRNIYGSARSAIVRDNSQLLIGTNKNFILYADHTFQFIPLVSGHTNKICGLCAGQYALFVTCGKDKRVIMWNSLQKRIVWTTEVHYEARCCAISTANRFVAVGCYTGHWVLLSATVGHRFNEGRVCYHPIDCIAFSPVDTYLAMGTQSGEIFVFVVTENNLTPQGKLTMPHGPTTHLDWAVDSYHIRTCSDDKKIYYWSIPLCKPDDSDYVKYDHYWWTKTCTASYVMAGIWAGTERLQDITASSVNASEKLVAAGDQQGRVSLLRFPCPTMKAKRITENGHGCKVRAVSFLKFTSKLVTIGGSDLSVFQWNICLRPYQF